MSFITTRLMRSAALACLALAGAAQAEETRDGFHMLDRLNRASLVMLSEQDIITDAQTALIADALETLRAAGAEPDFPRTLSYSSIEPFLIETAGPEVTRLHTARSTWDVGAVNRRMLQRESLLGTYEALIRARTALLDFAERHPDALIPAYTGGVQAQPTSLGHYLTAFAEAFGRHAEAIEAVYATLNLSPFGAAALGTSSYPTDRQRVSDLLGFAEPIHNSYDAVLLASQELNMRLAGTIAALAGTTNQLVQDLGNQYYLAKPWLTIPPNLSGGSTIMPQKLNPTAINTTRNDLTLLMGAVATYMFEIHNFETGYFGGGGGGDLGDSVDEAIFLASKSLTQVADMFDSFVFHEDRAMEVLLDDFATATELANALQRIGDIPFRDAHHVAAGIVQFGRDNGLRASEITYADFQDVYREVADHYGIPNETSGLTEEQFLATLRPENLVAGARGLGGPQPEQVRAMIAGNRDSVAADRAWAEAARQKQEEAAAALDAAFAALPGR